MRSFHFPGRSLGLWAPGHVRHLASRRQPRRPSRCCAPAATRSTRRSPPPRCWPWSMPHMTGIGGDCFALVAKPGAQEARSRSTPRDGRPRPPPPPGSPRTASTRIEPDSVHAVTVPGAIDGWMPPARGSRHHAARAAAGSRPSPWREEGFVVAPRVAVRLGARRRASCPPSPGPGSTCSRAARPPEAGEVMRFPALAATLKRIAKDGRDGFYRGRVGQGHGGRAQGAGRPAHARGLRRAGRQRQLRRRRSRCPIAASTWSSCRPSNQGIVALIMLKMLERLGKPRAEPVSTERYHVLMEAARLAYAMRDTFVADPDMADVPVEHMLDDEVIDNLVGPHRPQEAPARARAHAAAGRLRHGLLLRRRREGHGGVVHQLAVRRLRLRHRHGQDRRRPSTTAARASSLDPKHPNCIAPRKRPLHTLVPAMALKRRQAAAWRSASWARTSSPWATST